MRHRFEQLSSIAGYTGLLLMVFAALVLIPLLVQTVMSPRDPNEAAKSVFLIPALISFAVGLFLRAFGTAKALSASQAMLITVVGWLAVSAIGALPFWLMEVPNAAAQAREAAGVVNGAQISYLDAFFEATSGFTTTGMTTLVGLEYFPPSIIFWRSLSEWLGGLGILSFFVLVLFSAGASHTLYGTESTKIFSSRPVPGMFNTVRIIWTIYIAFTAAVFFMLVIAGLRPFEAMNFSLTTVSTGGFAPYDENAAYFAARAVLYPHYRAVEYVLIIGMLAGSISFLVHYRFLRGGPSAVWNSAEMKLWWFVLAAAGVIVTWDVARGGSISDFAQFEERLRTALFQTVSIFTTSGFTTRDLGDSALFTAASRQVFLLLMVIGAAAGSTSSGIKLFRVVLLGKAVKYEIMNAVRPRRAVKVLTLDGQTVETEEIIRTASIVFMWLLVVAAGGILTAFLTEFDAIESLSVSASAAFNIGPSFVNGAELAHLHWLVKMAYILIMLAGRLEILPVLLLFNRRAWM